MDTSESPPPANSASSDPVDLASANPHSLHRAIQARRSEYVRRRRIRVKVGTWNVAACTGTDKDLARWFVDGEGLDSTNKAAAANADHNNIGLYVLGLQEINTLTAPAQYLPNLPWGYSFKDTVVEEKWKAALEAALPKGYKFVAEERLAGLLLLVYASPEVHPLVGNVSTTTVSAGAVGGYIGNKGAVCCRILLGEVTSLLFVNCHLASGVEKSYIAHRIWQVQQIQTYARFEPITVGGVEEDERGKIGDEDFAFWFGDLNSRLDHLPGDEIRRLLTLHVRGEYDPSKKDLRSEDSLEGSGVVVQDSSDGKNDKTEDQPVVKKGGETVDEEADDDSINHLPDPDEFPLDPSDDPASLQTTIDSLLPHDQLRRLMKTREVFQDGWREGPITFLPSYKYDVGSVYLFDSSEKRRPPSWCDRILYRTRKQREDFEKKTKEDEERRKRDEEMKAQGMEQAGEDEDVLFSYDPDNDGEDQPSSVGKGYDEYEEGDDLDQKSGEESGDNLHLDLYTSHQRITASDHKPISSIFTMDYDAVDSELKAKVHAEVARELDRVENEGRPVITIVVEHQTSQTQRKSTPDQVEIDFGDLRFRKREICSMTLANTGGAPATFSFVEKPETDISSDSESVEWLATTFVQPEAAGGAESSTLDKEVTLEPGETVLAIVEACVHDIGQIRRLNEGKASLDEVLILRVQEGRDHFVPVRAAWSPTSIGRSVDELVRVSEGGIRAFGKSLAEKKGRLCTIPSTTSPCVNAPRELLALTQAIDKLTDRVLADEQMLEDCEVPAAPGWPFDESTWQFTDKETRNSWVADIVDALDQGINILDVFSPETPSAERFEAVAEVFLLFLRSLSGGIVTRSHWEAIEKMGIPALVQGVTASESTNEADKGTILDLLQDSPHYNISFLFVTTSLARTVAELAPVTKKDLEALKNEQNANASRGGGFGAFRKSIGFRRGTADVAAANAVIALSKRRAKETKYAEIFGPVVCRGSSIEKDKDRKTMEDRQKALVELFIRKRGD
ncbi:putative inositol-1,4,5-trisphosphate 5-phosphatase 3 [Podospora fimiseda]|uniref:Inositol-1,4,5-trisphosphate 5-phosphatase 3 n=1 Tax=Podospora fimiseda TaxID=252190 RepID=A0AAN6YNH4_9PEZI|nr:putative inositol-1,4,5-trisphosphate 5-phosphatase 3 [Podospora fimiseda]